MLRSNTNSRRTGAIPSLSATRTERVLAGSISAIT
jgi:hypothetical protein